MKISTLCAFTEDTMLVVLDAQEAKDWAHFIADNGTQQHGIHIHSLVHLTLHIDGQDTTLTGIILNRNHPQIKPNRTDDPAAAKRKRETTTSTVLDVPPSRPPERNSCILP